MQSSEFWENPFVQSAGYFSVVVLCLVIAMIIFEIVTKYKNWVEIKNGNVAVALATGGKILGICNIFRYSIERHATFVEMIGWGSFGFILGPLLAGALYDIRILYPFIAGLIILVLTTIFTFMWKGAKLQETVEK